MSKPLTDLQKSDLTDIPRAAVSMYELIVKLAGNKPVTPELAEARNKMLEAEFWIQQHILRNGSGKAQA